MLQPLVRNAKDEPLRGASWPEAFDRIATGVRSVQQRHGNNAVGIAAGGPLTNETAYLLGKLSHAVLRTTRIDYCGQLQLPPLSSAIVTALGIDRGLPFPVTDIEDAETILLAGTSALEKLPWAAERLKAQARNGGGLIAVDPAVTPLTKAATLHLQIQPGTETALALGLLYLVIREGHLDQSFIAARTVAFDCAQRDAAAYWPDRVARITGVPERRFLLAAQLLGQASSAMVLAPRDVSFCETGATEATAFLNLLLALGKVGKPRCGYAALLSGARVERPAAFDDTVQGVLAFGPGFQAARARQPLEFLAVCDSSLTETALTADVVLPCALAGEQEGTTANLEGKVRLRRGIAPPPDVKTELEIVTGIAKRFGHLRGFSEEPEEVFLELTCASAGGVADYAGMTYERLETEDGLFWPCASQEDGGTPRLFLDRFATPDGRARFQSVELPFDEPSELRHEIGAAAN